MQPIIVDWGKLIPPVDRADFPLPELTGTIPESATLMDKSTWKATNYVHRRAVNGTADAFTPEIWPNREQHLQNVIVEIVHSKRDWLKEQYELTDDADTDDQEYVVALGLRAALIQECRTQFGEYQQGIGPSVN